MFGRSKKKGGRRHSAALFAALQGLAWWSVQGLEVTVPGSALWFNGAGKDPAFSGHVAVENIAGGAAEAVTVSVWVRITKHQSHNLLAASRSRKRGWALFVDKAEKACFGLFVNKSLKTVSSRSLQQGREWHFISGVFTGSEIVVHVDAEPGEVVPMAGAELEVPWGGISLGGAPDWTSLRLDGTLGPAQLWASARSPHELARDMVEGPDPAHPDLMGLWLMKHPLRGNVLDSSHRGHSGEFNQTAGTPSWVRATQPLFVGAVARELNLTLHPATGAALALLGVPPEDGSEGTLHLVDNATQASLGPVPAVPWPVTPHRSLRYTSASRPTGVSQTDVVCAEVRVECDLLGVRSEHTIFLLPGGSEVGDLQRVKACKRHRYAQGILEAAPPGGGWSSPDLSIVFAQCDGGGLEAWDAFFGSLGPASPTVEALLVGDCISRAGAALSASGARRLETSADMHPDAALSVAVRAAHADWVHVASPDAPLAHSGLADAVKAMESRGVQAVAGGAFPRTRCMVECSHPWNETAGSPVCRELKPAQEARVLAAGSGLSEAWPAFLEGVMFRRTAWRAEPPRDLPRALATHVRVAEALARGEGRAAVLQGPLLEGPASAAACADTAEPLALLRAALSPG